MNPGRNGMSVPVSADPEYSVSGCSVRRSPVFPDIDKKKAFPDGFSGKACLTYAERFPAVYRKRIVSGISPNLFLNSSGQFSMSRPY